MCGIAGLGFLEEEKPDYCSILKRMASVIEHRGPDDEGYLISGPVGFAFRRLSIIDLKGGHQPMGNEDETIWVVFNGEIYNHLEIRAELELKGHRYHSRSDTETILHAYEEYGDRCVERFRGMFAFAIWDSRRRRLFAARDRLGIKPFYYTHSKRGFVFGSEIKSLLASGLVERVLNESALPEYFLFGYLAGDKTMFKGIQKLPPGNMLSLEDGRLEIRPYWDLPIDAPQFEEGYPVSRQLQELFDESVRLRLMSEVPLGAFLSGGVDSSSIVATAAKFSGDGLNTFSVGFGNGDANDERIFAKRIANQFRTTHKEIVLSQESAWDLVQSFAWHMDEPISDGPSIPLLMMSREARRYCTVLLSGEGADELFAGYHIYRWMRLSESIRRWTGLRWFDLPISVSKIGGRPTWWLTNPLPRKYWGVKARISGPAKPSVLAKDLWHENVDWIVPPVIEATYDRVRHLDPLKQMLYLDTKVWLPDNLLTRIDKMTMAASIELRVPFLDHKLVEFAFRIPDTLKIRNGESKYIEKKVLAKDLPSEIIHRKKIGFNTPIGEWLKQAWGEQILKLFRETQAFESYYFDKAAIRRVMNEHRTGQRDHADLLWSLLVFEVWHKLFFGSNGNDGFVRPQQG